MYFDHVHNKLLQIHFHLSKLPTSYPLLKKIYFLLLYVTVPLTCLYTMCVSAACRGQKRVLDD